MLAENTVIKSDRVNKQIICLRTLCKLLEELGLGEIGKWQNIIRATRNWKLCIIMTFHVQYIHEEQKE